MIFTWSFVNISLMVWLVTELSGAKLCPAQCSGRIEGFFNVSNLQPELRHALGGARGEAAEAAEGPVAIRHLPADQGNPPGVNVIKLFSFITDNEA